MAPIYVFSLILGGGFLALSVLGDLFGTHGDLDSGGDLDGFDGHLELDGGGVDPGHLDLHATPLDLDTGDMDLDSGHLDVATAHAELEADTGHLASKIFSIRTLFYSLFGFGSVGTLLTYLWSGNPLATAAFAIVSGITSGAVINAAFGYVRGSESGMVEAEAAYIGLQGRVTLPLRDEVPGQIVLERGGRRIALRALPHPSGPGDPASWREIFVIDMEKGVARVAPVDEELLLDS